MSENLYNPILYTEWVEEAEKVAREELEQYGFAPSPDSIMRCAHAYMLEVQENEHGGIGTITVQHGWQQAMRLKL